MTEESHNGFTTRHYIKDRTVIEDTESSLDLRMHGWRLENYPERLSYSATPPDFGALCVQRQRWANGGLLVLPRLLTLARSRDGRSRRAVAAETVPAAQLPRLDQLGQRGPVAAALLSLRPAAAVPLRGPHRDALLRCDLDRPASLRLQAARRPPPLRAQHDAAAGQHGRRGALDRAGDRRPEERVRPHAQGAEAHRHAARVRGVPVRARRLVVRDARERPRSAPLSARRRSRA